MKPNVTLLLREKTCLILHRYLTAFLCEDSILALAAVCHRLCDPPAHLAGRCLILTHIAAAQFSLLLQSLKGSSYQCGMVMNQTDKQTQTAAADLWRTKVVRVHIPPLILLCPLSLRLDRVSLFALLAVVVFSIRFLRFLQCRET